MFDSYREKNGVTPLDALNPNTKWVDEETGNKRFEICKSCPELFAPTAQCKLCGCFMRLKTKMESAKCPLEKWV
jgi:Family of unknown function (DUF6171)